MPSWRELKRFCERDRWELYKVELNADTILELNFDTTEDTYWLEMHPNGANAANIYDYVKDGFYKMQY